MKKLLKLNEILLLTIGGVLDVFQEIKDPGNLFQNYYSNFYGFVPQRWKKSNFYSLVHSSLETELIEKVEKNGQVFFQITRKGKDKIKKRFPLIYFQKKRWDKRWRLVIFDVKEIERHVRDGLRKKLKELGFGMVQRSVWLSPHDLLVDLRQFFEGKRIMKNILLTETKEIGVNDIKEFANKIWKLESINQKYLDIYGDLKKIEIILDSRTKQKDAFKGFKSLYQSFIELIIHDPFLPEELLPDDWLYLPVLNLIRKIKKKILRKSRKQSHKLVKDV